MKALINGIEITGEPIEFVELVKAFSYWETVSKPTGINHDGSIAFTQPEKYEHDCDCNFCNLKSKTL